MFGQFLTIKITAMKNTILFLSMLAMTLGFVACSNEDDIENEQPVKGQKITIFATSESCGGDDNASKLTRTQFGDEAKTTVVWSKNDKIIVDGHTFTLKSGDGQTDATFVSDEDIILEGGKEGIWGIGDKTKTYTAYYGTEYNNTNQKHTLPATQYYSVTRKISNAPMSASVKVVNNQAQDVTFKHLGGLLRLTLKKRASDPVRKIRTITITATQAMTGEFTVSSSSQATMSSPDNTNNMITLDCGESGVELTPAGTEFYIAMPVAKELNRTAGYANVSIQIKDINEQVSTMKLDSSKRLVITRGKITPASFVPFSSDTPKSGSHEGHEWVDLDLTSRTKWASKNIGAADEEDDGDYFAWGETADKTQKGYQWVDGVWTEQTSATKGYNWSNYKWGNSIPKFTKYWTQEANGVSATDTPDNITTLSLEDDAAHVHWGGDWRMPTKEEMEELLTECVWEKATTTASAQGYYVYRAKRNPDGTVALVNGQKVKDSDFGRIFFICSKYYDNTGQTTQYYTAYWSSTLVTTIGNYGDKRDRNAYCFGFASSSVPQRITDYERNCGLTVRPVLSGASTLLAK